MTKYLLGMLLLLTGCASQTPPQAINANPAASSEKVKLHQYIALMTKQLSVLNHALASDQRIAVSTFVGQTSMTIKPQHGQDAQLAQQVQETLMSYLTAAGVNVIEHRLGDAIVVTKGQSIALVNKDTELALKPLIPADLVIVGSILTQEKDYLLNARLVDTISGEVISAAMVEVPKDTLWSHEKVQLRNGHLYRASY